MPRQPKGGAQKKQADADYEEPKTKVRKLTVTHHGGNKAGAGAIPIVHDTADIKELEERRKQTLEQLRQVELGVGTFDWPSGAGASPATVSTREPPALLRFTTWRPSTSTWPTHRAMH